MSSLPIQLSGIVKPYKGNGRKFGYPTANIATSTTLADGVYFGFADLAGSVRAPAMIFIGTPTTVGDTERRIETHVLDFPDIDYYELPIMISIEHYHRPNKTFDSVERLLAIMHDDDTAGRQWFAFQTDDA